VSLFTTVLAFAAVRPLSSVIDHAGHACELPTWTAECAVCPAARPRPLADSFERPSRCIRAINVVRGTPKRAAAPFHPPITPLVARSVWTM
jgi:hypothetical protein